MTKLTPAEFKELEKATPNGNKLSNLERAALVSYCQDGLISFIYSGGKNLNVKRKFPPTINKIRFIVKPVVK